MSARDMHLMALACASLLVASSGTVAAQERLTSTRAATAGVVLDEVRFGAKGLAFTSSNGQGNDAVKSATQWTVPISLSLALGERWTVDLGSSYTRGEVTFASRAAGGPSTIRLSGAGDVRLRATGRIVGDNVLLTFGANLPTGMRDLDGDQITALGVLAAPALGIYLPGASFGPGATSGIVLTRDIGDWAVAAAGSYEVRRRFSPVAALTAGLPAAEFDPGDAIHVTLATDGLVGEGAVRLAVTGDLYAQDKLLQTGGGVAAGASVVRLGPTIGVEGQWQIPARGFRELTLYATEQYRSKFKRDGVSVPGSSGSYFVGGLRGARAVTPSTAITGNLQGWVHSGMSVDNSLVTAATTSGALTLGLSQRLGAGYELQPFVRARAGSIDTGLASGTVSGFTLGLTLATRF